MCACIKPNMGLGVCLEIDTSRKKGKCDTHIKMYSSHSFDAFKIDLNVSRITHRRVQCFPGKILKAANLKMGEDWNSLGGWKTRIALLEGRGCEFPATGTQCIPWLGLSLGPQKPGRSVLWKARWEEALPLRSSGHDMPRKRQEREKNCQVSKGNASYTGEQRCEGKTKAWHAIGVDNTDKQHGGETAWDPAWGFGREGSGARLRAHQWQVWCGPCRGRNSVKPPGAKTLRSPSSWCLCGQTWCHINSSTTFVRVSFAFGQSIG